MIKQWLWGFVVLGALLFVFAGIPQAMATESFGTEDWVMASETPSEGFRNLAAAYESFDALETGALPPTVSEEAWSKEYGVD